MQLAYEKKRPDRHHHHYYARCSVAELLKKNQKQFLLEHKILELLNNGLINAYQQNTDMHCTTQILSEVCS